MELAEVDDQRGADHREQRGEVAVQDVDHRQLHVRVTLLEESQKPASQSITKHIHSQRVRPRRRNFADLSDERERVDRHRQHVKTSWRGLFGVTEQTSADLEGAGVRTKTHPSKPCSPSQRSTSCFIFVRSLLISTTSLSGKTMR